jgi:biotin carboxylase
VAVVPERPLDICHAELFRPEEYEAVVTDHGDRAALIEALGSLGVAVVVAGCETGVELADELAAALGLAGNAPATSRRRRDKGLMAEALAVAGLDHTRTLRVDDLEGALGAARELGMGERRVVVKPSASTGNDSVFVCGSESEVEAGWLTIAGHVSRMGEANHDVLVQEFLEGTQYIVNTVSSVDRHGETVHFVCEVWRSGRSVTAGGRVIYGAQVLLDGAEAEAVRLARYTQRALTALGITTGAGHSELALTERGPVLIETGARMSGLVDVEARRQALGYSLPELAVHAATEPDGFARRYRGRTYGLEQAAIQLFLAAPRAGAISADGAARLLALPTVRSVAGDLTPGTPVSETVDLFTSPGQVNLVGARDDVEHDFRAIRELEQAGLYG